MKDYTYFTGHLQCGCLVAALADMNDGTTDEHLAEWVRRGLFIGKTNIPPRLQGGCSHVQDSTKVLSLAHVLVVFEFLARVGIDHWRLEGVTDGDCEEIKAALESACIILSGA